MQRPVGVTIISIFQLFIATILLVLAVASVLGMGFLGTFLGHSREIGAPGFVFLAGAGVVVGVVVVFFAALFATLGYGMWNLREWARIATMVLAVLGALGAAFGLFWGLTHFRVFMLSATAIRLGINLLILWYLNQQHVIAAFRSPPGTPVSVVG
jgi:hypothetical protein